MNRLSIIAGALFALSCASPALAEGCTVENGSDYRFERSFVERRVHDALDRGTIRLATYVYRPLKIDRHEVVLFAHGSTNGQTVDPHEPAASVPCSIKNYFLARGYTLVVPMRRGRGESTGTFVEECARNLDPACTPQQNRALAQWGLEEAIADSEAVLDKLVFGKLVASGRKLVLAGQSRGGFLALALAARHPDRVSAVINMSGGWLGFQPRLFDAAEREERLAWHRQRLSRFGAAYRLPALWLYGVGDPLYGNGVARAFHEAFRRGDLREAFHEIETRGIENAHLLFQESGLWAGIVDGFLGIKGPAAGTTDRGATGAGGPGGLSEAQ